MPTTYLLDSGPLGLLAHHKISRRMTLEIWLPAEISSGAKVMISEVADYEVRRELIRLIQSSQIPANRLQRLNLLPTMFPFLPVSTLAWKRAAELWADARSRGLPSASMAALDGDALIAAQADEIQATVLTSNAAHMGTWVPVKIWP